MFTFLWGTHDALGSHMHTNLIRNPLATERFIPRSISKSMFLWFGAFTKTLVGITELEFDATIFSFWVQEDFAFNAFCSKFYFQERERSWSRIAHNRNEWDWGAENQMEQAEPQLFLSHPPGLAEAGHRQACPKGQRRVPGLSTGGSEVLTPNKLYSGLFFLSVMLRYIASQVYWTPI